METLPTVDRNRRVCLFASIIGFTTLFLWSNHSQHSFNHFAPPNTAIPVISSLYSNPGMELEDPRRLNHSEPLKTENEEVKCDVFDGTWIYDPQSSPLYAAKQCPFLSEQVSCQKNGRPDSEYENWRWKPKWCNIPRFNGTEMLERLEGKRVIIVGDSLNRNQWESLACLLYSSIPSSRAHVDVAIGEHKVFKAKDFNCTVEFYWSPFLVDLEVKSNGSRILHLDKLSSYAQQWRSADIMVFNTGHWWVHSGKIRAWNMFQYRGKLMEEMETKSAITKAMRTWSRWIDRNANAANTTVFFRSISPEHKETDWCHNRTRPDSDQIAFELTFPKRIIQAVERRVGEMKTPVKYLNITRLSQYRRDAHPSFYARKKEKKFDCSHWCLPGLPDTWNNLLYASLVCDS